MVSRSLLLALAALWAPRQPVLGQSLLDLAVEQARGCERSMLMPVDVAEGLSGIRLESDSPSPSGELLLAALEQRGVLWTELPTGGRVLYRPGTDFARMILDLHAPLVEPAELPKRGNDLVWAVLSEDSVPDVSAAGERATASLLECSVGPHRILAGPARTILARLGMPPAERPSAVLTAMDGPALPGGVVLEDLVRGRDDEACVFTYDAETGLQLQGLRVWSDKGAGAALAEVGYGPIEGFPAETGVFEVPSWIPEPFFRGACVYAEDVQSLAPLSPHVMATIVIHVRYRDPRTIANALRELTPRFLEMLPAGNSSSLVLTGPAGPVHRWCRILERIDVPEAE